MRHGPDQFGGGDVIGLKAQGIDQHLKHLVTVTGKTGLKHRLQPLKAVLQVLGIAQQRAFRHGTGHVDDDDGKFAKVHLVDGVILGPFGEQTLGGVHGIAHIGQDLGLVPAEFELQRDTGIALFGGARHGFQPVEIGQFGLHRLNQQLFRILGGNTGEGDRDENRGDFDVRFTLFGQARIGQCPRQ